MFSFMDDFAKKSIRSARRAVPKKKAPARRVGASAGAKAGKAKARAYVAPKKVYRAPAPKKKAPAKKTYVAPKKTYSAPKRTTTTKRAPAKANSFSGNNLSNQSSRISSNSAPAYTPPPPPKPPTEAEWLAGDTAYQDQTSEYEKALQDFVARIAEREGEIKQDADLAIQANQRNQTQGLNSNAEDFASRGMINSGLFADSAEQLSDRYNEARGSIETNRGRQIGALADERETYQRENELGRNNARRQALQRMALQWGVI